MTPDLEVAKHFSGSRLETGAHYIGTKPENAIVVACDLKYPISQPIADGPLSRAIKMEDKWDIFFHEGNMYFIRSWTGDLIFLAACQIVGNELTINQIVAQPASQEVIEQLSIQQVDFLIKSHVLGVEVPHPLPPNLPMEIKSIVMYSFSRFGRRASFATYSDTSLIPTDWSRWLVL